MPRPVVPSLLSLLLLLGCDRGADRPRDWGEPQLAEAGHCPDLVGRYLTDESPVPWMLALRRIPAELPAEAAESFAVLAQRDSSMQVSVRFADGQEYETTLRRGDSQGGDYFCEDGWLRFRLDGGPSRWDSLVRPAGHTAKRRELRVAPAPDGALLARLDGVWFEGVQLYAPSGGDGAPIPWTWRRAHVWLRTERYSAAGLARRRRLGTPEAQARRAARERAQQDPIYQENQALEDPPPPASQASAQARIREAVPEGMRVLVVAPRDSGWHVSVVARDPVQLTEFLSRLAQRDDVAAVWHDALVRTLQPDGTTSTAVYVRLEPDRLRD